VTLAIDSSLAKEMSASTGSETTPIDDGVIQKSIEFDREFSRIAPGDDAWWMDELLSLGNAVQKSYAFSLTGLTPDTSAELVVELWGGNDDLDQRLDHNVILLVNDERVNRTRFDGVSHQKIEVEVPADVLREGRNIVSVKVKSSGRRHVDLVRIDSVSLAATRKLVGRHRIDFVSDGGTHRVEIKSPETAVAYLADETITRVPVDVDADRNSIQVTGSAGRYFVATQLEDARESNGLSVKIVDVRDIYRRYSGGAISAQAIADAIGDAYRSRGTKYVLLVGDDTYDYRNNLNSKSKSYIPTHYAATGRHIRQASADALYGDIDGDLLPEVAVGRMPVKNMRQLARVIDKTLIYDSNTATNNVLFAADSADDASRHSFRKDSRRLRSAAAASFETQTAYVDQLGVKTARKKVIDAIEQGTRLTSYIGHSDRGQWSFENLLSNADIRNLGNIDTPTVVTQFGCWNNDFVHPTRTSIGETFLVSSRGGAAAVIGTSALSGIQTEAQFGVLLYEELTKPGMTLGEAMNTARRRLAAQRPLVQIRDVLIGTSLLGDPAIVPNSTSASN